MSKAPGPEGLPQFRYFCTPVHNGSHSFGRRPKSQTQKVETADRSNVTVVRQ